MIQSDQVSIVKDKTRLEGRPMDWSFLELQNSKDAKKSYLHVWIPMCFTIFFLYGRYLSKHLDSGIQSIQELEIRDPKDKMIFEEFKKVSGGKTLSTI